MRSSVTAGSHRLSQAAENSAGSTGGGPAPNLFDKPFTNGPSTPSPTLSGLVVTTKNSGQRGSLAIRRFAPSPSNGFAYCSAVGRIASLTTRRPISGPSLAVGPNRRQRKLLCNFSGKLLLT